MWDVGVRKNLQGCNWRLWAKARIFKIVSTGAAGKLPWVCSGVRPCSSSTRITSGSTRVPLIKGGDVSLALERVDDSLNESFSLRREFGSGLKLPAGVKAQELAERCRSGDPASENLDKCSSV
jgi:hypothetical protein